MRAFTNKGRFSELMKRIPVHVIVTNAALLGAAAYAIGELDGLTRLTPWKCFQLFTSPDTAKRHGL